MLPLTNTDLRTKVAITEGDGIGPEIMAATRRILEAAGAPIDWVPVSMGEKVYLSGQNAGIAPEAWQLMREAGVLLKAPMTTPLGEGYKSLNVTLRKSLGLFANVRPTQAYHPYVNTHFPNLDVVVIRENEEDLYAGIEHQQTEDVVQCLKLITRPGCEKIVRYAFEYARLNGRKKVTCMTKSNIMKLTDGLFARVFKEIAPEYPEITSEHMIIDIGTARLATEPENFDVIVTTNLYGDILSDVVSQLAGSVGLAGSANIGQEFAMFEAIHGSAPDIAGRGIANPSGLLQAAVLMLRHLGYSAIAERIQQAWQATLADGIHTADIYQEAISKHKVDTQAFADAVISRLPKVLPDAPQNGQGSSTPRIENPAYERKTRSKKLVGIDVFIDWQGEDPNIIGKALSLLAGPRLKLKMITNRGVKVFPNGLPETFCTD
ncbi:MAG: NADP-dependent isocitrate dehydrogenase, partial [Bacteroidota bacterium]